MNERVLVECALTMMLVVNIALWCTEYDDNSVTVVLAYLCYHYKWYTSKLADTNIATSILQSRFRRSMLVSSRHNVNANRKKQNNDSDMRKNNGCNATLIIIMIILLQLLMM
jgi:hypothetical protein